MSGKETNDTMIKSSNRGEETEKVKSSTRDEEIENKACNKKQRNQKKKVLKTELKKPKMIWKSPQKEVN